MSDWLLRIRLFYQSLRRALGFVWASSPRLALASIAVRVVQGLLPLVLLYMTKLLIDAVTVVLAMPPPERTLEPIIVVLAAITGVTVVGAMASTLSSLISRVYSQVVTDYMLAVLQKKSVEVDLEYYENAAYQDTLHRAQQEAPYRPKAILEASLQFGQDAISLLGVAGILWWLHWAVIPILMVTAVPYFLVRVVHANRTFAWQRERTPVERRAWYYNFLVTQGMAAKEVRLFDLGERFQEGFRSLRALLCRERITLERRWAVFSLLAQVVGIVGVFGVYSWVTVSTVQGALTVGDLVMYFQAVQRAASYLEGLGWTVSSLYESNLFLTTLEEFLGVSSRLGHAPSPKAFPKPVREGIRFEQVSFQYMQETRVAIRDLTFTIRPGEHVAFVGANGAGKTTLVKLLCRLYDPSGGRITVDGIDLREFPLQEVRGAVSGIFQDFVKYHMSARDNITLGARADSTDAAVVAAAQQAGVHEAIARLPQRYDAQLGKLFDGGHELSIGEWQKVALARAVLRDSQLLILDEPTSAMDAKAEAELFERFHELAKGRMAILISHRLSTVKMVDRICVVDEGRIVEEGTHDVLMQKQGLYAKLFLTQAQHYQ